MQHTLNFRRFWLGLLHGMLALSLLSAGAARAAEPTMAQIYAAAQAGKLDQAQTMVQQVLISHPNSAKAFYVQSELYARQGDLERARASLANADKLAPGLPFADSKAVGALRAQIASVPHAAPAVGSAGAAPAPQAPASSGTNWLLPLLLAGGVIVVVFLVVRKNNAKQRLATGYAPTAAPNSLQGPQNFGANSYPNQPYPGQPYGPAGQGGYGAPAGSGLGGRIAGGLATGLAVGAGVVAAQAIAKSFSGENATDNSSHSGAGQPPAADYSANTNADMGGNNFGIQDSGSWDDGSASAGLDAGSSDWDS